mgnify:CR=1 FL=1
MSEVREDWRAAMAVELKKPYYRELSRFVNQEYRSYTVYPPKDDIYNAFKETSLSEVKVLLLGQDPYHNEHQAHGMSFSVLPDQPDLPPSLQNIYKELQEDLEAEIGRLGGKWSLYLKRLDTDQVIGINEDEKMVAASLRL